jgi:hypothetical protein
MDILGNLLFKFSFLYILLETKLVSILGFESLTILQKFYLIGIYSLIAMFVTVIAFAIENMLRMQEYNVLHLFLYMMCGSLLFWIFSTIEPQLVLNLRGGWQYLVYIVYGFFFSSYRKRY